MTTEQTTRVGKATYTNKATGETYHLGFDLGEFESELAKAWTLVKTAAALKGWNRFDITAATGWN